MLKRCSIISRAMTRSTESDFIFRGFSRSLPLVRSRPIPVPFVFLMTRLRNESSAEPSSRMKGPAVAGSRVLERLKEEIRRSVLT